MSKADQGKTESRDWIVGASVIFLPVQLLMFTAVLIIPMIPKWNSGIEMDRHHGTSRHGLGPRV